MTLDGYFMFPNNYFWKKLLIPLALSALVIVYAKYAYVHIRKRKKVERGKTERSLMRDFNDS